MNVSLNPHYNQMIEELVSSGKYNSASEVIRNGLRLLEQEHKETLLRTEYYRRELLKGVDSGSAGEWDTTSFLEKAKERAAK